MGPDEETDHGMVDFRGKAMSRMIINEPPLQVLPSLAKAIGLNEAIILQQIHYWLENPKAGITDGDGVKWIFNTYEEWGEQFTFWSISTIQRAFSSLEKRGLLVSEQLNKNKHDMTKFYRIDYGVLETMEHVNLTSSNVPSWYDVNRNTETTTETTTEGEGRPSRGKTRDRRLDHPAIVGYKEIARLNVAVIWRDDVINTVTDDPEKITVWRGLIKEWVGHHWNPGNISGMLDAFRSGGLKNGKASYTEQNQRIPKGV